MRAFLNSAFAARSLPALVLALAASGLAQAQTTAPAGAADQALESVQIERLLGQVLGSIDLNAVAQEVERSVADAAAGKPPRDPAQNPALREMQARMQAQMAELAPQLVRGLLAAMTPLLAELKAEIGRDLAPPAPDPPAIRN